MPHGNLINHKYSRRINIHYNSRQDRRLAEYHRKGQFKKIKMYSGRKNETYSVDKQIAQYRFVLIIKREKNQFNTFPLITFYY